MILLGYLFFPAKPKWCCEAQSARDGVSFWWPYRCLSNVVGSEENIIAFKENSYGMIWLSSYKYHINTI